MLKLSGYSFSLKWFSSVLIVVLLAPVLSSCKERGRSDASLKSYEISRKLGIHKLPFHKKSDFDDEFIPHIRAFEALYGGGIGEMAVTFGRSNVFGICRIQWSGRKRVNIKKDRWVEMGQRENGFLKQRIMLFHELGHCVLNHMHHRDGRILVNKLNIDGTMGVVDAPESIMASTLSNWDLNIIVDNFDHYIRELFDGVPVPRAE